MIYLTIEMRDQGWRHKTPFF